MAVSGRRGRATKASVSGSDEYYRLVCLPCHRDEKTLPAFGYCIDCHEHLCRICYTHHKTPTPCRHHILQDKDAMPHTQRLDTSVNANITNNLTTPCPRHKNEIIKLYCRGHNLLICSVCVALDHTKPCQVDYIPDISDRIINSQDYRHTIDRMDKLLKKCSSIETENLRETNTSNDSLQSASMKLKKYRQEVNKRIDELQTKVENKIQVLRHQNNERKKTAETICEDVKKTVKVMCDDMKQMNTSKQADQLFMTVKQFQSQLYEYENTICSISVAGCIEKYTFVPNKQISGVLLKENMIGDICEIYQGRGSSASQNQTVSAMRQARGRTVSQYQTVSAMRQARGRTVSQHQQVGMSFPFSRMSGSGSCSDISDKYQTVRSAASHDRKVSTANRKYRSRSCDA